MRPLWYVWLRAFGREETGQIVASPWRRVDLAHADFWTADQWIRRQGVLCGSAVALPYGENPGAGSVVNEAEGAGRVVNEAEGAGSVVNEAEGAG